MATKIKTKEIVRYPPPQINVEKWGSAKDLRPVQRGTDHQRTHPLMWMNYDSAPLALALGRWR